MAKNLNARSQNFCFTQNNYVDTKLVDSIECKYIIYGKEVGDSGTPHLQGVVVFPTQRSLGSVIKKLPGCHVEITRALPEAIQYCKKEGDFTERGTPPKTPKDKGAVTADKWKRAREVSL